MSQQSSYTVHCITDLFVLISDDDREGYRSVTNDAENVVRSIHENVTSLKHRRVFYLDSAGQIDELEQEEGRFEDLAHAQKASAICWPAICPNSPFEAC